MCSIAEIILYHRYFITKLSYPITRPRLLQYLCPNDYSRILLLFCPKAIYTHCIDLQCCTLCTVVYEFKIKQYKTQTCLSGAKQFLNLKHKP